MTEIEFLRSEYQVLVCRIGLMSNLSLSLMELVLAKDPGLAPVLLAAMREKLDQKTYAGTPEVSVGTVAHEKAIFEAEIAPFLERIS